MKKYRCGIVGCKARADGHAQVYDLIDRGDLVACCDHNAASRKKFSEQFGIKCYAEAEDMIDAENLDLVHLVTKVASRVPLMRIVSDKKVPACIVEKPIACGAKDWKQLCRLEAESKTKFAVSHQLRWHPDLNRCHDALMSGKLGKLMFLDFSSGMNISAQGTHMLDYAMSLNGDSPVVSVFGASSGNKEIDSDHPGPETTVAQVVFENGVHGVWTAGTAAPKIADNDFWQHCRLAGYAEKGRVLWEDCGKWEVVGFGNEHIEEGLHPADQWQDRSDVAQIEFTNDVFNWIEESSKPVGTNLKLALHQWKAVLALYASSLLRKPINLADFDPPDDLFDQLNRAMED